MNFCTYFSKGVADYVAIWDFDEFFIPRGKNKNLLDVIENAYQAEPLDPEISRKFAESNSDNSLWTGGRGWADGNGHPFCFLQVLYVISRCNTSYCVFDRTQHCFVFFSN